MLRASLSEIRLTFTEPVEARLARVRLLTADTVQLPLGGLHSGDSAHVLVAPVSSPLGRGTYTVLWQVMGTDGHPVHGRFSFVVAAPERVDTAIGSIVVPDGDTTRGPRLGQEMVEAPTANSPGYVAVRWLTYAALMVVIGAIGFRYVVLGPLRQATAVSGEVLFASGAARAAAIGRGALIFLMLAAGVRLLVQVSALAMPDADGVAMQSVILGTIWGWGWMLQVAGAAVGVAAFHLARRTPGSGWPLALAVAVVLAFTPALSGHAVSMERLRGLAILADSAHVFAVAAWLGTLLLVIGVGMPEAVRLDSASAPAAAAAMVSAFSPAALVFAGTAAATGVASAILQLSSVAALWTTAYGRVLIIKLAVVALVAIAGAFNWRRVKPRLATAGDIERLRASARLELAAGAIVLLITAVLVAMPTH